MTFAFYILILLQLISLVGVATADLSNPQDAKLFKYTSVCWILVSMLTAYSSMVLK